MVLSGISGNYWMDCYKIFYMFNVPRVVAFPCTKPGYAEKPDFLGNWGSCLHGLKKPAY